MIDDSPLITFLITLLMQECDSSRIYKENRSGAERIELPTNLKKQRKLKKKGDYL